MGTTPVLVKALSQVNTTDAAAAGEDGTALQYDGQVVGLPDGGYAVFWTDESRTYNINGPTIVSHRYDSAGEKLGGEAFVTLSSQAVSASQAAAASSGTGGAIVYTARLGFSTENVTVQSPQAQTSELSNTFDPAVTTFADGSFVYAYTIGSGSDTDIAFRRVSASGQISPTRLFIHDEADRSGNVELATLSNGGWVAVFRDEFNGIATDTDIRFRVYAGETPVTESTPLPGGADGVAENQPDVAALGGGGFVVVWTDAGTTATDIRAAIFTNTGGFVATNILVNASQTGPQDEASVVGLLDGGFLVTWDDDGANRVLAQRFDALGNRIGDEITVFSSSSSDPSEPEVARLADGRVAFTLTRPSVGGLDSDVWTSMWNPRGSVAALPDVLWRQTDHTLATGTRELLRTTSSWQTQGTGDFDRDGDSDILWRHQQGQTVTWVMENDAVVTARNLPTVTGSWRIAGTGDFDDDGDDDVVWHHPQGQVVLWEMESGGYVRSRSLPNSGGSWEIADTGDFDGDGDADLLWHHPQGQVVIWELEGGAFVRTRSLPTGGAWRLEGTGDFDRDGDDDILWHHPQGNVVIWQMESGALVNARNVASAAGAWTVAGVHDFNSDGDADILWRNTATGQVVTWDIEAFALARTTNFGIVGSDWQIRGTGEFV